MLPFVCAVWASTVTTVLLVGAKQCCNCMPRLWLQRWLDVLRDMERRNGTIALEALFLEGGVDVLVRLVQRMTVQGAFI